MRPPLTRQGRLDRYPALAAAIFLHAGLFAAVMLLGALFNRPVYGPTVTPVTLISAEQNPAPAIESPTPTPDVTPPTPPEPEPAPQPPQPEQPPAPTPPTSKPKPATPPPTPAPKPAKAAPAPKPVPKPTPTAPSKSQAQATQAQPDDDSFMNSLGKDLAHGGAPSHPKPPSRPTPGTGSAPSAAALASLSAQLQRLWNPNCDVMGGADVNLTVHFVLGPSGRVIGQPVSSVAESADPIVKAASERAIRAVFQAQPITGLGPDHYTVNFNAHQACGQ